VGCGALALFILNPQRTPSPSVVEQELPNTKAVGSAAVTQAATVVAETPAEPEIDPAALLLDRERAENRLGGFLEKKQELDRNGVLEWGDREYAAVLALSKTADQAFLREDYPGAVTAYEEAIAKSDALLSRIPEALTELLEAGKTALAQTQGELAKRKFQAALDIDPDLKSAAEGLQRSKTIERVESLMKSGADDEIEEQYALAITDYQEAAQLDPHHPAAAAAVTRVGERIRETKFRQLMTEALRAIETEELSAAEAMLIEAKSLYPGSAEVKDASFRVVEARRLIRIRELIELAREAETTENWKKANDGYRKILEIDPLITEAVTGSGRTETRIRLLGQMKYCLDHRDELHTEKTRAHAVMILSEAKDVGGKEMQWLHDVSAFEDAVVAATTPVPVVIESDGQTSVDVYRVGRFGTFVSKDLSLLPGTYTVVGHRKGYKDVRRKLIVDPGSESVQTTVTCRERI